MFLVGGGAISFCASVIQSVYTSVRQEFRTDKGFWDHSLIRAFWKYRGGSDDHKELCMDDSLESEIHINWCEIDPEPPETYHDRISR